MEIHSQTSASELDWCTYMLLTGHAEAHHLAVERLAFVDRAEATKILLSCFESEENPEMCLKILESISNHQNPATSWVIGRILELVQEPKFQTVRQRALELLG
ncbi:MAG: hypothetical protein OEY44_01640 [Candidatus Peregrinibacteria bacterium]|nr:hypothetical protein [Candidatus Peregrinibacteria bacterium]